MEAAPLDRTLFSDLEALVGDRRLSGAQRRGVLWPSGLAPDGMLCVVLHLAGHLQRADDHGGDHLQSEALLALCRLRSSCTQSTFTEGGRESRMNTSGRIYEFGDRAKSNKASKR